MSYGALTAFLGNDLMVEDHRSHAQWVEAMYQTRWKDMRVPDEIRDDLIKLLDAAAKRAATRSGAAAKS